MTGRMATSTFSMGIMAIIPWVLFLLVATSPTLFRAADAKIVYSHDSVNIENQMAGAITVHCKSKDNDLGAHILGPQGKYDWQFHVNFWGTTLFWCTFTSPTGRQKTLQVWSATVMKHSECYAKCYWYVRNNGFWVTDYNYKYDPMSEKFMVPW